MTNQDKTRAVVSRAMAKHNLEVEPEEGYELVQVISEDKGTTYHFSLKMQSGSANNFTYLHMYTYICVHIYTYISPTLIGVNYH